MKRRLILAIAVTVFAKSVVLSEEPVSLSRTVKGAVVAAVEPAPATEKRASPNAKPPTRALASHGQASWSAFQSKYGRGLEPVYSSEGCIESLRPGSGHLAGVSGFDSNEPQQAIRRAREILGDLKALLCLGEGLDSPLARGNSTSVQVSFHQTHQGLPVIPRGNLTLDLGSKGEILGLFSNPSRFDRIANERRLSDADAQSKVMETLQGSATSLKLEGGGPVIWVASDRTALHAYRYAASGRELVIDAQNGAVLSGRDLRHN